MSILDYVKETLLGFTPEDPALIIYLTSDNIEKNIFSNTVSAYHQLNNN